MVENGWELLMKSIKRFCEVRALEVGETAGHIEGLREKPRPFLDGLDEQ